MSYFVELQEHNGLSRCLNNNFHDHRVIIFYKPGCGPCSNLLGQLTNYIDNSQNHKQRIKDQKLIILTINCADPKFKNLLTQNIPLFGICLGHQLLCGYSEEGNVDCLNIIPIHVQRLMNVRVIPHMGWNTVKLQRNTGLTVGLDMTSDVYFVHGYAPECRSPYTVATCDYGDVFSAMIRKDNFYGVQFHPEKSGEVGLQLLKNFVRLG